MSKTRTFYFKEGQHKSRPIIKDSVLPRRKVGPRVFKCQFKANCEYVFRDRNGMIHENQWDFNKGRGNSHCYFDNHIDAYMKGWRWNPTEEMMDLTSYWHMEGKRYMGPSKVLIVPEDKELLSVQEELLGYNSTWEAKLMGVDIMARVELEESFYFRILTDWDVMEFGIGFRASSTNWKWVDDWQKMAHVGKTTRDILYWFGGDFAAPHFMQIQEQKV